MERLALGKAAQLALIRFLVKLNLLATNDVEELDLSKWEECPIAHFARSGCFDEWDAITIVAQALDLKAHRITKADQQRYVNLCKEPFFDKIDLARLASLRVLPIELSSESVGLLMANPLDHDTRSTLEFDFGRAVKISVGVEQEILTTLSALGLEARSISLQAILSETAEREDERLASAAERESHVDRADLEAAPIVKLVNKIFYDAVHLGASDIHVTPEKDEISVRIRVDGIMRTLFAVPAALRDGVISRIKLLSGMDIAERRKPQDGRIRIKTGLGVKDLRVSTVPAIHGENVVCRILSSEVKNISFESLGMPTNRIEQFKRALLGSSRVVLVSGPTGSGKTSSLYAALLHLRDGKTNMITVEDPIEYRIGGITQIQVNPKVGMTFAQGLRAILRQDPDIVMVGEIRDHETAEIAMQMAQTGHLVLSTIHTNSAPATITRLRDLGIPAYIIASSLGSVLAQRLVRTLCGKCKAPLTGEQLEYCKRLELDIGKIFTAVGCEDCQSTGYLGRIGIYSFLEITEPLREAIRVESAEMECATIARKSGFTTLQEEGLQLLYDGRTSVEELERVVGPVEAVKDDNVTPAIESEVAEAGLAKRRVLLVEDDQNLRLVLTAVLEREMFEVQEACDGVEALEKIYQKIPALVLCDLMMPRMNGFELVKRLRRDNRTARIPVLMLTAADSEEIEAKLISSGVDDFVKKTARTEVMLARVHRLLERSS